MAKARLNSTLLKKMARKLKREANLVRQGISHRASRLGVGSEAAQLLWADELGIAIGGSMGGVPAHVQQQVREHRSGGAATKPAPRGGRGTTVPRVQRKGDGVRASVNLLLRDPDLKARCGDVLKGAKHFDRAVNQATQVFETRLRSLASAPKTAKGPGLAAIVFKSKGPLILMSDDPDVQDGYMHLAIGLFAVFRNATHHGFTDISREDATSICGFINALLDAVANSTRVGPQAAGPSSPPASGP